MSHKLYRMCLLSVVIIAIVGGIFYYLNYVRDETDITEGTLVRNEEIREAKMKKEPVKTVRMQKEQTKDNSHMFQEDEKAVPRNEA